MKAAAFATALLFATVPAPPAEAQVKPADAIRYRQSAYQVLAWNFMPMSAMARGKLPFDARKFGMHAERVALLAPQLLEGFTVGSHVGDTEAKPEIWANWADFQKKMKTLESEARKLAESCKAADEAAIKVQFGRVGAACKACHDQYKKD
jgi:cytochrome c556